MFRVPGGLFFAAAIVLLGTFAAPVRAADDLTTLAKRVQVLEDREAIRALILAYGQATRSPRLQNVRELVRGQRRMGRRFRLGERARRDLCAHGQEHRSQTRFPKDRARST